MRKAFLFLLGILSLTVSNAQERSLMVLESQIFYTYPAFKNWTLSTATAQRTIWNNTNEGQQAQLAFLEVDQFITTRFSPKIRASFGYKYRNTDPVDQLQINEQRLTQQVVYSHLERKMRLLSRMRLEQRFRTAGYANRFRYRLGLDMPLSGEKLDVKEFYGLVSNEVLYETQRGEFSTWDNRISAGLGYYVSQAVKFELTSTLRMEDLERANERLLFINTTLFLTTRNK